MIIICKGVRGKRGLLRRMLEAYKSYFGEPTPDAIRPLFAAVLKKTVDAAFEEALNGYEDPPLDEAREENSHLSTLKTIFSPCTCHDSWRLDLLPWYTSGFE